MNSIAAPVSRLPTYHDGIASNPVLKAGKLIIGLIDANAYLCTMPARKTAGPASESQFDRFKELARELGCDDNEAAFDAALRKLADVKAIPKHEPKKRALPAKKRVSARANREGG
jgi:hypothetical protein